MVLRRSILERRDVAWILPELFRLQHPAHDFAGLMSIYNAGGQLSQISGGYLYERLFNQQIAPLIWVAAIFTLGAYLLVPFLPSTSDGAHDQDK